MPTRNDVELVYILLTSRLEASFLGSAVLDMVLLGISKVLGGDEGFPRISQLSSVLDVGFSFGRY